MNRRYGGLEWEGAKGGGALQGNNKDRQEYTLELIKILFKINFSDSLCVEHTVLYRDPMFGKTGTGNNVP